MISKKNILTIILDSIFVIAFNILFFLNGGTEHTTAIWIAYGFLHFSYAMVLITPLISAHGSTAVISKTTTYTISILYFLVESIMSIIVFLGKTGKTKVIISTEVIVTATFLIILIINLLADDDIEKKQAKHEVQNDFIKTISNQIKYIETIVSDPSAKNKINNLYYLAHSSPIKSNQSLDFYENEIIRNISLMEQSAQNKEIEQVLSISSEIEKLLNKRNFEIKANH